jgi:hypothetical protein
MSNFSMMEGNQIGQLSKPSIRAIKIRTPIPPRISLATDVGFVSRFMLILLRYLLG